MPKINIRTLNGIRTATTPKGRDVAEALDDIVAAISKLTAPAQSPVTTTPVTQGPTTPVSKTPASTPTSPGTGGGSNPPAPVTTGVNLPWIWARSF